MKRRYYAAGVTVLILVILVGVFLFLSQPVTPDGPLSPNPDNTELYRTLAQNGLNESVVDVTSNRALVRYERPENMSREQSVLFVFGAAAATAENSSRIVAEIYTEDLTRVYRASVETESVRAFVEERISYGELQAAINENTTRVPP